MSLHRTLTTLLVLLECASASAECTNIIYVDAAAIGAGNGTSWENAYNTLQDALLNPGQADCVWVASADEHHYTPDQGPGITSGDRSATFQLLDNVAIYGGFRGTAYPLVGGETTAAERDPATHVTILSGEIGAPDTSDNSYHVITASGVGQTAVLDGFTITAGNADGIPPHNTGAGMFNEGGSPTVINCVFADNEGTKGAGMHNLAGGDPMVINCVFRQNVALGGGGILDIDSSPAITNCIFAGNSACTGGAMANLDSSAVITSNPTIVNSTFVGNAADPGEGGGIWNLDSAPTVSNCILWSNTGGEIIDYSGAGTTVTYSDVEGGWTGSGGNNLNEDPLFVDAAGPDEEYGTEDDDLHLLSGSPCLDAGDNLAVPLDDADLDNDGDTSEPVPVDLDGARRFIDDPSSPDTGNGTPPIVDMGSYEFCPAVDAPTRPDPPGLDERFYDKNRYLSFLPGNPGVQTALRITLQGSDPVLSWWVGEPQEVSENAGKVDPAQAPGWPTFWAAKRECEPCVKDWPATIGSGVALHVYGPDIAPDERTYEVQAIHENCLPGVERNFSAPLPIPMSKWGDIAGQFDPVNNLWTAPDGSVDIPTDVQAVLDKFRNLSGAPIKARCDVEPHTVDLKIEMTDVTAVLDAYRGFPYPFPPPTSGCD